MLDCLVVGKAGLQMLKYDRQELSIPRLRRGQDYLWTIALQTYQEQEDNCHYIQLVSF